MSHEIRTPMNAIIGLTHLLRQDPKRPRRQDRLGKIADAAGAPAAGHQRHPRPVEDRGRQGRARGTDFSLAVLLLRARRWWPTRTRAKGLVLGWHRRRRARRAARRPDAAGRRRCSTC
jgi:hypothetical protein